MDRTHLELIMLVNLKCEAMKCCSLLFYHLFLIPVENESHCDFMKLREMLIRTNMEDMREKTHVRHYELYRKKRLEQVTDNSVVVRTVYRILIISLDLFYILSSEFLKMYLKQNILHIIFGVHATVSHTVT
jgi:hypothetical protein